MFSDTYQRAPIAIYDSGIGGLLVARAIQKLLPHESIHYIGDTKNLPYGSKTSIALCGYIAQVVNFCLSKRYKLLVIACNTATAAADHFLPSYLKAIGVEIDRVNVIDPVISYIHATNLYKHIGLIGTKYTVAYGIYPERFRTVGIKLSALATPRLVPMVEACFNNNKIDHVLLDHYLTQIISPSLDALIPACTHYLFLEKAIKNFLKRRYQKKIDVIDVAKLTALAVQELLARRSLLNKTAQKLPDCFMATQLTSSFKNASKKLFGQIPLEINLKDYTQSLHLDCLSKQVASPLLHLT